MKVSRRRFLGSAAAAASCLALNKAVAGSFPLFNVGAVGTGWTIINPVLTTTQLLQQGTDYTGSGSRIIYVANSGLDTNKGTQASPVASLAHAVTLLRNGFSDQLLLNKGDTWIGDGFNYLSVSGVSAGTVGQICSGQLLIGTYGTGARPLVKVDANSPSVLGIGTLGVGHPGGDYMVVQGIEFYNYTTDPANAGYLRANVGVTMCTRFLTKNNWTLIEDCKISFGALSFDYGNTPNTFASFGTVIINRCVIVDSWNTSGDVQGCYMAGIADVQFIECVSDHNGWNSTLIASTAVAVTNASPGVFTWPSAVPFQNGDSLYPTATLDGLTAGTQYFVVSSGVDGVNKFRLSLTSGGAAINTSGSSSLNFQWGDPSANIRSRNFYIQDNQGPCTFRGNISAQSGSEGAQFRSGGTVTNNLFVAGSNGFDIGHPNSPDGALAITSCVASNNVVIHSGDIQQVPAALPRTQGINIMNANTSGIQVTNNIIAHASASGSSVNQLGIHVDNTCTGVNLTGNYIFDWANPIIDNGTGTVLSGNVLDATGSNTSGIPPEPFSTPTLTVESYYTSIGGDGTLAGFMAQARLQSRDNWRPQYTANAVNNYIRAGFGR